MSIRDRLIVRFAVAATLMTLPAALMAACGGGIDEGSASAANVPELGAAQLGAGAGPTPIPVTPTPTPTPSPSHLTLFDPVWEGTYTVHDAAAGTDTTKTMVLEVMPTEMIGEGSTRRRDQGAALIEGATKWLALSFVRIDPETGSFAFQLQVLRARFEGVIEGDKITGTVQEGPASKGTFELHANRDKKPQRRPDAET